ncbi:hypothetical protein KC19_7G039000 [Ceratodon purpureus]|uniref:Uncharacterized protein n=1 Tax=Ceratodon purpureus TaxID=3225 RepID=A0A8T0H6U5_CERPU|nr:hypothetical protein KC19_7G039000 [Ceratodon purpureus]
MVAQKEEEVPVDGKSELDLGIEESIRRCEALLSMVPISLQPILADGVFRRISSKKDVAEPQFESKMAALEPEWTKNMGLLSGIMDQKSNASTLEGSETHSIDISISSETVSEKPAQQISKIPKPPKSKDNSSVASQQIDRISLQGGEKGPKESSFHKKIHIKRRCSRSSDASSTASASEDWTIDFTQTAEPSTTSVSGTQDDHSIEEAKNSLCMEGTGEKESTPSMKNEKQCLSTTESPFSKESEKQCLSTTESSFSMENINEKKSFVIYDSGLHLEDVTQLTSVPSIPTTATPTEGDVEEIATRKAGISMNSDTSRSSCRSFEALCFTITAPGPNCEEAWEWLDKRSNENISPSDLNYEGNVIHEPHLPPRDKKVKHFLQPQLKPDGKALDRVHLAVKSAETSAKLKPRGSTTNLRRANGVPAIEKLAIEKLNSCQEGPKTCRSRSQAVCTTDGKLKTHVAAMARLRRLAKPRTALYQRYAQTRALKEEEQMSECSFKPIVGRRPDPDSPLSVPIFDRIGEMKQRIDLRKRARKMIEKEELEQCSFWPKINLSSGYLDKDAYQPIQGRLQDLLKKRNERIARARAQEAKEKGLTFKPAINQKSVRLFKQKGLEAIKVSDRLTSCTSSPSEGQGDCRARTYKPKDECTFTPEINPNTDYILSGSELDGCSFLTRQQQFLRKLEERKRQKEMEGGQCTFRPNIGNASVILQCSPLQDGNEETLDERLERLSHRDSQRRFHIRQRISDNYYSQFKFQPKIDQVSRMLSPSTNLHELYKNEKGKRSKEVLQQAAEQEFVQACTFHPEVNVRKSAGSLEGVLENRRRFRQEKAKNFEQLRVQKEMQEFKECTFKPDVHPLPPKEKERVVIKGLGRHLELQDLAKQMKKDQEEWERKVFFTHVYDLPKRQYTIPKPFVLHSGRATHKVTAPEKEVKKNQASPETPPSSQSDSNENDSDTKAGSCSNMSICTSSLEKREID